MKIQERLLIQVKEVQQEFISLLSRSQHDDVSDLPETEVIRFNTRARALIHRIGATNSAYVKQCEEIVNHGGFPGFMARRLAGVVDSLGADISAGFLETQRELIHGELFADFLEMAQHLLGEGYKDASAVITGSSLEAHLRQLATKSGLEVQVGKGNNISPKKADRLNSDLAKANIYSILDQKSITAWLDLRNKAAHGHYDQYDKAQVGLMISGVRDFIARNPA